MTACAHGCAAGGLALAAALVGGALQRAEAALLRVGTALLAECVPLLAMATLLCAGATLLAGRTPLRTRAAVFAEHERLNDEPT